MFTNTVRKALIA
jgi:hypothetical protein